LYPERIERRGDEIWLGVAGKDACPSADIIYAIMESIATSAISRDAKLVWLFSAVAVRVAELSLWVDRWREKGEPPLLSITALDLADTRHVTLGLRAFCGFELAATFCDWCQSRDAARNLALLARGMPLNSGSWALDVSNSGRHFTR
jgi:hypothetical protein